MPVSLPPRELEVMTVLWELGDATVAEVRERLRDLLAYTSVLSALQLLEHKGHVGHRREGRAYRYHALIEPREVRESTLKRIIRRVYRDSPARLVAQLLEQEEMTKEELESLREMVERRLAEREGEAER